MAYNYGEIATYIKDSGCELLTSRDEYKNTREKLKIKCWRCGEIFEQSFSGFRNSQHKTCRKCRYFLGGQKKAKTTEEFKKEVYELEGNNYEVLGEYINAHTKIKMKHNKCGYEYYIEPNNFLDKNYRCPNCNPKKKKTHRDFIKEVYDLVGDEYTVLDRYKNTMDKLRIKHNICGYTWHISPNNFLQGTRCPYCYRSKGEEEIAKILDINDIKYKEEYTFEDCTYIESLRFDFYLFDYNICIEYDGIQHFKPCGFGEKDEDEIMRKFNLVQKRDKIKNQYCKDNNIKLIRIPYYEFDNIENIINERILKKIA